EAIPIEARILAVADSFDAMSSNRPYRRRLSLMQIDEIFRMGRGIQWDPGVVDALFSCRSDLEAIRQKGLGESLIGAVDVALGQRCPRLFGAILSRLTRQSRVATIGGDRQLGRGEFPPNDRARSPVRSRAVDPATCGTRQGALSEPRP